MYNQEIGKKVMYWLERAGTSHIQEGLNWYQNCHDYCLDLSEEFNVPVKKIAGILSALSPMKEYSYNKKLVKQFLECQTCGHLTNQIAKCRFIYNSQSNDELIMAILSGRKTSSFYHNIVYPTSSEKVTIDFRIWQHFKHDDWKHITDKRYSILEDTIIYHSRKVRIMPNQLQAILWLTCKYDKNVT